PDRFSGKYQPSPVLGYCRSKRLISPLQCDSLGIGTSHIHTKRRDKAGWYFNALMKTHWDASGIYKLKGVIGSRGIWHIASDYQKRILFPHSLVQLAAP